MYLEDAARSLSAFQGPNLRVARIDFPWMNRETGNLDDFLQDELSRPKSPKVTEWSFDFDDFDDGMRLVFSCWGRQQAEPNTVSMSLKRCVELMKIGGPVSMILQQYPDPDDVELSGRTDELAIDSPTDSSD